MSCPLDTILSHLKHGKYSEQAHALRKLRAMIKVEPSSFIVQNSQQLVTCIVTYLANDSPEHFPDLIALLKDAMRYLNAQTTRILDEILPHLVNRLIHCEVEEVAGADSSTENIFQVLNQFLMLTQNVHAVIDMFISMGLSPTSKASKETTIECIFRIIQDCRHSGALPIDLSVYAMIMQGLVCVLEDKDESVVVAAECFIAKLQNIARLPLHKVKELLTAEDKVKLTHHEIPIKVFLDAITAESTIEPEKDTSASLPESIISDLEKSLGNSNVDWKNRSRAIRQLVGYIGRIEASDLALSIGKLVPLLGILGRLLHDVDLHIVKNSLQVALALFEATCFCHQNETLEDEIVKTCERYTTQFTFDLLELMTMLPEDPDDVTLLVHKILRCLLCSCRSFCLTALLMTSFKNRRWQIREQGLKVWMLRLLLSQSVVDQATVNRSFVELFAKLLCDVNARVREMSLQAAVVMEQVGISIYAQLENMKDEALRSEIDFSRLKQVLAFDGEGPRLLPSGIIHVPKLCVESGKNNRLSVSSKRRVREAEGDKLGISSKSHLPSNAQSAGNDSLGLGRCRSVPEWRISRTNDQKEFEASSMSQESLRSPQPVESMAAFRSSGDLSARNEKLFLLKKKAEKLRNPSMDDVNPDERLHQSAGVSPSSLARPEERPIRPLSTSSAGMYAQTDLTDAFSASVQVNEPPSKKEKSNLSLATRKRMEARQQKPQTLEQELEPSQNVFIATNGSPKLPESVAPSLDVKPQKGPRKGKEAMLDRQSSFESNGTKYVQEEELKSFQNPKAELSKLVDGLHSSNWEDNFQALTSLRRLAVYHSSFLEDRLHGMVLEILAQVRNLRSSVSKNALLAMDTLTSVYGKAIDPELENIVPLLLKRCADSNAFVCESASNSIFAILRSCSLSKVFSSLLVHANAKAVPIRREVAQSILRLIQIQQDQILAGREQDRIISLAGKFLEDTSSQVRDIAKECFYALQVELGLDSSVFKRLLSASLYLKIEKISSQSFRKDEEKNQAPRATSALKKKRNRPISGSQANLTDDMEVIIKRLDSGDWKERLEAISPLRAFVMQHANALNQTGKAVSIFDCVARRMDDGNLKVSLAMMEEGGSILSALHLSLESSLGMLLPVLAKNVSSNSNRIASLSKTVLESLRSLSIDPRNLCQQFAAIVRNTNTRSKAVLLDCITEIAIESDEKCHAFMIRHIIPLAIEMLKEAKSDVKQANSKLMRALHTIVPNFLTVEVQKLDPKTQAQVQAILRL